MEKEKMAIIQWDDINNEARERLVDEFIAHYPDDEIDCPGCDGDGVYMTYGPTEPDDMFETTCAICEGRGVIVCDPENEYVRDLVRGMLERQFPIPIEWQKETDSVKMYDKK